MIRISPTRHGNATVVALAAAVLLGILLFVLGVSPWVAPAAVALAVTLALGQWMSWSGAFASSIVVQFVGASALVRVSASLPGGLVAWATVMFLLFGAVAVVVLATRRSPRSPRGFQWLGAGVVVVAISAFVAATVIRAIPGADFEWAMHNDAVWNLATTRFVIADGGIDNAVHPNSSPLTATLMAAVASVGRAAVPATDLLRHDVTRVVEFWLLAGMGTSLLAGMVGYRAAAQARPVRRWAAAAVVGLLPITWFVFGFATDYGFYNATIVVVVLLITWLLWLEGKTAPMLSSAILSLAAVCMLATWAPLALIPLALAVLLQMPTARQILAARGRSRWTRLALAAAVLLPVPVYAVAVTLPDLRRDGAALAVEGAFMPFVPLHLFTIAAAAAAVVMAVGACTSDRHLVGGFLGILVSGGIALGYLVYQRRGAASLWGYYPAKFAWFLAILLLVVLCAELLRSANRPGVSRVLSWTSAAVALVVPLTLMSHLAPPAGWRTALTPAAIALQLGGAAPRDAAESLFEVVEDGVPTMVLSYRDESTDRFINGWLLQLESSQSTDPVRLYSYILDPRNEEQACEAIEAWNRTVRVITADSALDERLERSCPDADFRVEVRPSAAS